MKDRSFVDFLCGAAACLSVLGFCAILRDSELAAAERRRLLDERWRLGGKRRRRSIEDYCRHCAGTGECEECSPLPCRACRGKGMQPHDESLIPKLVQLWGRVA